MNASTDLAVNGPAMRRALGASGRRGPRVAPTSILLAILVALAAVAVGAIVPRVDPKLLIAGIASCGLMAAIAVRPQIAGYTIIGLTPLIAGIDRGAVIPVFRPSEAVALLAAAGLTLGALRRGRVAEFTIPRLRSADVSIMLLCVLSSIVPILWMLFRHAQVTSDDILYALTIWKFYAVYIIFRCSIRTVAQVKVCLYTAMASAGLVAVIAILQALQLFGVTPFLQHYYAPYGVQSEVANARGGATLSLPIAVADLMVFNIAVAFGLLIRGTTRNEARFLVASSILFVMGVLAAGEVTGIIALLVAGVALAVVTQRGRYLARMVPVLIPLAVFLQPVLQKRLGDIDHSSGLPVSWVGRLDNLRTFFWPRLFTHMNFVLGIRPSARVATTKFASGWVWIESGYTWLLWGGGIPLLLAYLYFTRANIRVNLPIAKFRRDAVGAAALAVVVALVAIAVCMTLDPHLTYRGSADYLFALLALAAVGTPAVTRTRTETQPRPHLVPARVSQPNGNGNGNRNGSGPR